MNTCLQCLISLPELNYYFSSGNYKGRKSPVACNALKEFIDTYNNAGNSLKACASIYKICHSFLEPNQQHDCQEFLRLLWICYGLLKVVRSAKQECKNYYKYKFYFHCHM